MRNRIQARSRTGNRSAPRSKHATLASLMNREPLEQTSARLPPATFGKAGLEGVAGQAGAFTAHIPDDRIAVRFLLQG